MRSARRHTPKASSSRCYAALQQMSLLFLLLLILPSDARTPLLPRGSRNDLAGSTGKDGADINWMRGLSGNLELEKVGDMTSQELDQSRSLEDIRPRRSSNHLFTATSSYVNCEAFKPVPQGKYLFSPSVHALHKCYRIGVNRQEMQRGLIRNEEGRLRYELAELYISCKDAFVPDYLIEMNDRLRLAYQVCVRSNSLEDETRRNIEERFYPRNSDYVEWRGNTEATVHQPHVVTAQPRYEESYEDSSEESSPTPSPTTTTSTTTTTTTSTTTEYPSIPMPMLGLDRRAFVDCSHVETELFADTFESPSQVALQKCTKYGVTAADLERGLAWSSAMPGTIRDVSSLFIACSEVFDRYLEYVTSELRDDYWACKEVGALDEYSQRLIERKFHDSLIRKSPRV